MLWRALRYVNARLRRSLQLRVLPGANQNGQTYYWCKNGGLGGAPSEGIETFTGLFKCNSVPVVVIVNSAISANITSVVTSAFNAPSTQVSGNPKPCSSLRLPEPGSGGRNGSRRCILTNRPWLNIPGRRVRFRVISFRPTFSLHFLSDISVDAFAVQTIGNAYSARIILDGSMRAARSTAGSAASRAAASRTSAGAMSMDGSVPLTPKRRVWT
jgi:hypothetical protein